MFHLFTDLDFTTIIFLVLALCFVLFYEAINGFHDTANAVATVIYTRALKEQIAVIMAGLFNFLGVLFGGLSVAYAIVHLLPTDLLLNMNSAHGLAMVFSILLSAILWNLGTWYFGIPASSSHTLIGAIIGVALANAYFTDTSIIEALNIPKMVSILLSLILSPLVGLIIAGFVIFVLRKIWKGTKKKERIFMTPTEREKVDGKRKPPFWIRIMLIGTAAGVSFSHGANDGQKGIGLLMLVLMGIAPAGFIVNMNASTYDITRTRDSIRHIEEYFIQHHQSLNHIIGKQHVINESLPVTDLNKYHCVYSQSFMTLNMAKSMFNTLNSFDELSVEERTQARRILLCLSDTVATIAKQPEISAGDKRYLNQLKENVLTTVEYAPLWIIIAIATALAVGTMIGWRRVVITIGEKIGKKGMTYAQGFAAQLTTAVSIGIASFTGMPVSTTQVLSSSVAGTMLVDGGGVQTKTIKNIALTWILTLPAAILLSASLFGLARILI
ncbi:inorganic phosphate transporter PitA [Candidatus Schmidhempelia bombi]|jgi:low-affinity inorganic phosphate transporter|uniref:Phosphate transporter n=1 Tax=Candidatus Schmidhempelia bombi str. Bimp TaxID=1387197 RepID=A0AB94IF76_9GAMM|nr:inorganic phosphate transporter PitA [Candidatus Schmidhempelia bombi]TEA28164.1 inorganic phosphate transporter PitA [Candidatus Schmidhempelia bombi str. Bimp]